MNSRFIFFLSLQSIKENSVCVGFLSMLLVDRDVWLVEKEWFLFCLFIYLFISFIKVHLLPTGLRLPIEKQISLLKKLVSKVPN